MYMLMIADEVVALGTELECYVAWQALDADYDCAHLDALVVALPV